MSLNDIKMNSSDLLQKEDLDSGGFGAVSLCYHRTHGFVILKKVYTGPKRMEYNESLLEEGKMMHRLSHSRVMRLLGVIIEEGNYSLVMEYMEKGNLMQVLRAQISIPLSVKGRIIAEIIEGMCYLHGAGVIHKDLKPENILVDNDFHIKIADLGVASFKTWSKLTKEEHNEQRKANSTSKKNGGTLYYMAPEHLSDINVRPTEKSDVYSFGIVLWAIFANKEPYENAISAEHLLICIRTGNRPNVEEITERCPKEIIHLMELCWEEDPEVRPTFPSIEEQFKPFYESELEEFVEKDLKSLKKEYPMQNEVLRRMQSLQLDCVAEPPSRSNSEQPGSLHSSQGLEIGPVEESWFSASLEHQQEEHEPILQHKLQEEANYHVFGSRMDRQTKQQPRQNVAYNMEEERRRRVSHDPFAQPRPAESAQNTRVKSPAYPSAVIHSNAGHQPTGVASQPQVPYWSNEFYNLSGRGIRPLDPGTPGSGIWYALHPSQMPNLFKTPVPETNPAGSTPTLPFYSLPSTDELMKCNISNSTGIQIGTYNYMEIGGMNSQLDNVCTNLEEESASKYQAIFGSGETDFGPQLKSLSKKLFTVVAWDPRGYGHSRPPDRDFPVDFYERDAKDAVDLMKALNFKKVSLLGWSGGGLTALIAAAKYPAHISKMVIWGAIAYITDEDQRIYEGIRDVSKWSEKARKPLEALYGYDYFAKTCAKWVDGMQQFKHLDGNICRHLLPQVQCPTLIVHGEKDPLVPRFHADFLHKHVRGSQLHLMPEGKHNLHLRFANEFNKLAEDFLQ